MKWKVSAVASALTLFAAPAFSQTVESCAHAIVRDQATQNLSRRDRFFLYSMINEGSFNEAKRGLLAGATAMIGEIPITGNTTYNEFNIARRNALQIYHTESETDINLNTSIAYLSANSTISYVECLRSIRNQRGLYGRILYGNPNSDVLVLEFNFITGTNDQTSRRARIQVAGGGRIEPEDKAQIERNFQRSQGFMVPITRTNMDRQTLVILSISDDSGSVDPADQWSISIPARTRVFVEELEESDRIGNFTLRAQSAHIPGCVAPSPGFRFPVNQTVRFSAPRYDRDHVESCAPAAPVVTAGQVCVVSGAIRTNGGYDDSCHFQFYVRETRTRRVELKD